MNEKKEEKKKKCNNFILFRRIGIISFISSDVKWRKSIYTNSSSTNQPTSKAGVVIKWIQEHAITQEQIHCVACSQSQGSAQENDIPTTRSRLFSISNTNIDSVYLKINLQILGIIFKGRKIKMVNPRDWSREDPRFTIKCTAFIQSSQFKRDDGIEPTKTGIPLYVEMDSFRLDVDSSDGFL